MLASLAFLVPRLIIAPIASVWVANLPLPNALRPADAETGQVASCKRDNGSMEDSHEQRDGQTMRWRASWSGDRCSVDFRANGKVTFNSDFTDVVGISNGGRLDVTDVDGNTTRRLRLEHDGSGGLVRSWSVNGHNQPWDDQGRRWLAGILIELDRISAEGVEYRYPALVRAGGPRAVLDEVEKMHGDYARSVYLRRLIDSERLSDVEFQRVVAVASRDISSDYEMSRILRAVADRASLENAAMRTSYLAAVGRMSSDYERSRVLQTLFAKSSTNNEVATAAVRAAGSFSSDYERSRVLLAAIESKALAGDDVIPVLETITRSTSDYEKSRVLLAVAGKWTLSGAGRKAYLRAADTIHSDYENRRVLAALVRQEAR
ncbi:MAG: hypothetical protein JWM41_3062 [Gemmatimonadetes bacterium]|nr:hypothetical protein [Gemmatimonadota bacterium]